MGFPHAGKDTSCFEAGVERKCGTVGRYRAVDLGNLLGGKIKLRGFEYVRPQSMREVCKIAFEEGPRTRIMPIGTDLLPTSTLREVGECPLLIAAPQEIKYTHELEQQSEIMTEATRRKAHPIADTSGSPRVTGGAWSVSM
jgi:hypothetical protein